MRFAILAGLMAAAAYAAPGEGLFERAVCNRDNCFRAVLRMDTSLAACSSYQKTTVTACATPTSAGCKATTTAPTATPTYASVCKGTAAYSSACSCNGAPGTTSTITPAASGPSPSPTFSFVLNIASGTGQGKIAEDRPPTNGQGSRIIFGDGTALVFKLDTNGYLMPAAADFVFYTAQSDSGSDVVSGVTMPADVTKLKCTLGNPTGTSGDFSCTRSGYTDNEFSVANGDNDLLFFGFSDEDPVTLMWSRA